jgi:predicted ATPase
MVAEKALQRCAYREATAYLTKGLALLQKLPNTSEYLQQELGLQSTLGLGLAATKGIAASEVEQTYARARQLCQQSGETSQFLPVLYGLWQFYLARGELHVA